MPDPIDYFGRIAPPDPNAFINGVNMVNAPIVARQTQQFNALKLQQAQQEMSDTQRYQADVASAIQNPSADSFRNLTLRYPKQHEALKAAWGQYSDGEQRRNTEAAASIYAAISAGKTDIALSTLKARQQALKGAGQDTSETDALIQLLESGDPKQIARAKGVAGLVLAVSTGPDKIGATLDALTRGGDKGYTLSPGQHRFDEDNNDVASVADKPDFLVVPEGGSAVPLNAAAAAVGGVGGGSGGNQATGVSPAAASVASTLASAGLPAAVVAGFMGNFHVEGGYDGAQGDGGSASGIAQWHSDRAATFERVIGKPVTQASHAEQAQFVAWEMQHPEAAGMTVKQRDEILAAKTPAQAAALIDKYYERSSGAGRSGRMAAANAFANGSAPPVTSAQPGDRPGTIYGRPKPTARVLTSAEAQAKGLDPKKVYEQRPDGSISAVGDAVAGNDDLPGNTNLTGEPYLATVPKNLATQVRALADGRLPLPSSFALSKPYWQRLMQMTAQYDPNFDAANAKTRQKTRLEFTSGKAAANITSFNTVLGHLDTLDHRIDDLHNRSSPMWNSIANRAVSATGDPRITNFNTAKQAVKSELTRAFRGSSGNVADLQEFEQNLDASHSPEQLHAAVKTLVDLLESRVNALGEQYSAGMGKSIDGINLLDSKARKVLERLKGGESGGQLPAGAKLLGRSKKTGRNVYLVDGKQVYGP